MGCSSKESASKEMYSSEDQVCTPVDINENTLPHTQQDK